MTFVPRGNLGVNSFEAAAAAARAGIGIAQIPLPLGLPALESGELLAMMTDQAAAAPALKLVYPSNRYLTAKVRAFADFVSEILPAKRSSPELEADRGALRTATPSSKKPRPRRRDR